MRRALLTRSLPSYPISHPSIPVLSLEDPILRLEDDSATAAANMPISHSVPSHARLPNRPYRRSLGLGSCLSPILLDMLHLKARVPPNRVVLDEGHVIKTRKTRQAKAGFCGQGTVSLFRPSHGKDNRGGPILMYLIAGRAQMGAHRNAHPK